MSNPFFSIIIPLFNEEKNILKVIDHLDNQSFKDFEVIIVDDQSADNSYHAAKKAIGRNKKYHLVQCEENVGCGGARNLGMKLSKGVYTLFHDADDWLSPNALEEISRCIKNHKNPDLIVFDFTRFSNEEEKLQQQSIDKSLGEIATGKEVFESICHAKTSNVTWNKAMRSSLLENLNIHFPLKSINEDVATVPYICYKAEQVIILRKSLYNYRENTRGTSFGPLKFSISSAFISIDHLFSLFEESGNKSQNRNALIERALRSFQWNLKIRYERFTDYQLKTFILHFIGFCKKESVMLIDLIGSEAGLRMLSTIQRLYFERKVDLDFTYTINNDELVRLIDQQNTLDHQLNLVVSTRGQRISKHGDGDPDLLLKLDVLEAKRAQFEKKQVANEKKIDQLKEQVGLKRKKIRTLQKDFGHLPAWYVRLGSIFKIFNRN